MFWERKIYIFTIFYILGIFLIFANHNLIPFYYALIFTIVVLLSGLIFAFISLKRSGFIGFLPLFLIFYLFPFLLGITLTLNKFNINKTGHILQITKGKDSVRATVYGYIYREPEYFENKIRVYIKPIKISINNNKSKRVKYGKILLNYSMKHGKFPPYLQYGHFITFRGTLKKPQEEQNPGGFNYRKFLESKGVFYTLYLNSDKSITPDEIVKKNPLFAFSLNLKNKFLNTIRKTVRFPESAFLGGITLGLRYGLEGVRINKNAKYQIKDDFKRAGVNHVLAVSGLHVTIITLFFIGIFSLFGVSRRIYPIITVFFLIIFAIITGGRPSTLRAVIMNGFILLFWAFSRRGIKGSTQIGITLAALLILLFNPLLLREASFTLSFGAVLSLVLITPFIDDLLKKYLIGYTFWAFMLVFFAFPILLILFKERFFNSIFLYVYLIFSAIFLYFSIKIEEKTKLPYPQYRKLPGWLISFFSAQFAIQFGMMLPLSSYYFGRYPIAGMFANYIAIPLIGINVQIGLIAAIFSLIPVVGIYMALLLNAGNYLLLKLFINTAHWFSIHFPYPYVKKMSFGGLIYYFFILLLIVNFPWIKEKYFDFKYYLKLFKQKRDKRYYLLKFVPYFATGIFLIISLILLLPYERKADFDMTLFSLSRGNVVFIKSLNGKNILINAGKYTRYGTKEWDEADRVIMSSLMHYGITRLDVLIATDYSVDNFSALPTIIDEYRVKELVVPTHLENIPNLSYEQFIFTTNDDYLKRNMSRYWVRGYYTRSKLAAQIVKNKHIPIKIVKTGNYIFKEEKRRGNVKKILEIYALYPPKRKKEDFLNDNLVIKVDYIEKKEGLEVLRKQFLINGALNRDATRSLLNIKKYYNNIDVFLSPNRFLYNSFLKNILTVAKPIDFLFHLNYFKYNKEYNKLIEDYGFLKEKYGTNFYDLSKGYVRYIIKNRKLLRRGKTNNISVENLDYTDEF